MTAVAWFAKELKKRYKRNNAHLTISQWSENMIDKLFKQANEMFEQQMQDSFIEGHNVCRCVTDNPDEAKECFEEWFKTYKKD
jgi:tRNA(Ile)-lysidine synthase TilS/MesJ